jgi:hypothetical protein
LENLPSSFQTAVYEAAKVTSGGKVVKGTLNLNRKGIKLKFSIRKKNNFYPLSSVTNVVAEADPQTLKFSTFRSNFSFLDIIRHRHRHRAHRIKF